MINQLLIILALTGSPKDLVQYNVLVDTPISQGSGILVADNHVLTVQHILKDATDITIIYELKGVGEIKLKADPVAISESEDLALLKMRGSLTFPCVKFANETPEVGSEVYHVGNFNGEVQANSLSSGVMSYTRRHDIYDQISAVAYVGSSGGGVYHESKCIGLVCKIGGPGITLIIPVWRLRAWAKAEKIEWIFDTPQG